MLPLLRVLTSEAGTLAAHAEAYADLAADEISAFRRHWLRSALAWIVAAVCALSTLLLGGVALMLWATVPVAIEGRQWLLIAVPAVPGVSTLVAVWYARRVPDLPAFAELRQQMRQDLSMLQESLSR